MNGKYYKYFDKFFFLEERFKCERVYFLFIYFEVVDLNYLKIYLKIKFY